MRKAVVIAVALAASASSVAIAVAATGAPAATGGDPTLTLVKVLVNTGGGTARLRDFTLTASGNGVILSGPSGTEGVTNVDLFSGTYALSESGPDGYSPSVWSCVGASSFTTNSVTLVAGNVATCSITNTFVPATTTTTTTTTMPTTTTTTEGDATPTTTLPDGDSPPAPAPSPSIAQEQQQIQVAPGVTAGNG